MDFEPIVNMIMSYGGLGACLVYFIYKDSKANAETRKCCEDNTKAIAEFTAVLNIVKDLIKK